MDPMDQLIYSADLVSLQWFQVAFYAAATPFILSNLYRFGKPGIAGWAFLFIFCAIKITGVALMQTARTPHTLEVGSIIFSTALSPLFFSILGVWHQLVLVRVPRSPMASFQVQIFMHVLVVTAIVLIIVGAIKETDINNKDSGHHLQIGGVVLFILAWLSICFLTVCLSRVDGPRSPGRQLCFALKLCVPLLGVRVLYSVLGACIDNESWSILTGGTLAEQVTLATVPEMLIVILLNVGGLFSKRYATEKTPQELSDRRNDAV